ncbi:MAG: hypothetical protein AB7P99_07920 [Vicinamibacterales bacterium]
MRNRIVSILSALAVLIASQPVLAQAPPGVIAGDPAKAAELLTQARSALGGDEKLRAVRTLELRGDFRRSAGNNQIEGELELFIEAPDKMKRVEDTSQPGGGPASVSTQVLNGSTVWDENTGGLAGGFGGGGLGGGGFRGGGRGGFGGGGFRRGGDGGGDGGAAPQPGAQQGQGRGNVDPQVLRDAQRRQRQAELSRLLIAWLLTSDAPATWIGTAESPEGTADVVEFRPADGTAATRLFLDAASHMPLMITWQAAAAGRGRGGRRGGGQGGAQGGVQPGGQGDGQAAAPAQPAQPVTQRMTLADYKETGGIKLPHTITRGIGGQTTEEWSIDRYRVNQTFRPDTFEQKQ